MRGAGASSAKPLNDNALFRRLFWKNLAKKARAAPEGPPSFPCPRKGPKQPVRSSRILPTSISARMQDKVTMSSSQLSAVESAIHKSRLARYCPGKTYDREISISVYLWNCQLSEAFQFPLHVAEISCRNAIQKGLRARFRNPWYSQVEFTRLLDDRNREHLRSVLDDEKEQHATRMNDDHVVSSLNFGFWDHLTTKRFERTLWLRGIKHNFPNAHADNLTRQDVNDLIQRVRRWRNRIAHHRAIFDKAPERKLTETLTLIEWVCSDTAQWVRDLTGVPEILKRSPIPAAPTP